MGEERGEIDVAAGLYDSEMVVDGESETEWKIMEVEDDEDVSGMPSLLSDHELESPPSDCISKRVGDRRFYVCFGLSGVQIF